MPDSLAFTSPVGYPGAIVWLDGNLLVQNIVDRWVFFEPFSARKRELGRTKLWGIPCLKSPDGLEFRDFAACEPMRSMLLRDNRLILQGPVDMAFADPRKLGPVTTQPINFKNVYGVAGDREALYFLSDGVIFKQAGNVTTLNAPSLPPSTGLVKIGADFYTVTRGTGQLLKLSPMPDSSTLNITGFSPPLLIMPYGLTYDPKENVFWISSPTMSQIFRVKPKVMNFSAMQSGIIGTDPTPINGDLAKDTVWDSSREQLIVGKQIKVLPQATLTIRPGTTVKFGSGAGIIVEGTLIAEGQTDQPVTLGPYYENEWWEGIKIAPGGQVKLKDASISLAKRAIVADDPQSLEIIESKITKITGDGVTVQIRRNWPDVFVFERNLFEEIGGRAIGVVLGKELTDPPDAPWKITGNTIMHSGSAIEIGPATTTPLKERIKETASPFSGPKPLSIIISQNAIKRNLNMGIGISGDGLKFPISLSFRENAMYNCAFLGDAVVINEVAFAIIAENAITGSRIGFNLANATVNLRPGVTATRELNLVANFIDTTGYGILAFGRAQHHELINNFVRSGSTYPAHQMFSQMDLTNFPTNDMFLEGNMFAPASPVAPAMSIIAGFVNRGNSTAPLNMPILEGVVLKGIGMLPGVGIKVDIRDTAGRPIKDTITNAAGKFALSLKPGDYFIRAGGAIQWSRLKVSPTTPNICNLTAP